MQHRTTTKEWIARSFIELSHKKSIDKITIKDIVTNCGLTKATFYNHFQDKYDLIAWIYTKPVHDIICRINDAGYTFREALTANLNYFAGNREYIINALTNTSGQNSFINYAFRINFTLLHDLIKSSCKIEILPLRITALIKLYVFGTVQFECEWLIDNMPIPIEEFADILESGMPEELKSYLYKM